MKLRSIIAAGALSAMLGLYATAKKTTLLDSSTPVTIRENGVDNTVHVPAYNLIKVPPGHCTQYARMLAHDLAGMDFLPGDAWDRIYVDDATPVEGTLEDLANRGILKKGMLIGIKNPRTSRTAQLDRECKPARFTHIGEYVGRDPQGKVVIAEQYGWEKTVGTEAALLDRGLTPTYVFSPKASK